jgi:hypothetical protein
VPSFEAYYEEEMIWSKESPQRRKAYLPLVEKRKAERAVESC